MPTPTVVQTASPTPVITNLIIECVFSDGLVKSTEADEYVQVLNGWRLVDQSDGTPTFVFPTYMLLAKSSVRVYTNEEHPESGGVSFVRGTSLWNNSNPDEAALINPSGTTVST